LEGARCSLQNLGERGEKLRSRQIDLKERAAAAKMAGWTKAVEKVRSRR
jgi:hypothetical protein